MFFAILKVCGHDRSVAVAVWCDTAEKGWMFGFVANPTDRVMVTVRINKGAIAPSHVKLIGKFEYHGKASSPASGPA